MTNTIRLLAAILLAGLALLSVQAQDDMAYLGVSTSSADAALGKHFGLPEGAGLVVDHVFPDTPAADIFEAHDLLHRFDGQLLTSPRQLAILVRSKKPGDKVKLEFMRQGKQHATEAELGRTAAKALPAQRPNPLNLFMDAPNVGPLFDLGNAGNLRKQLENMEKDLENNLGNLAPMLQQLGGQLGQALEANGGDLLEELQDGIMQLEDGKLGLGGAMLDGLFNMQAQQLGGAKGMAASVRMNQNGTDYEFTKEDDNMHFKATDPAGDILFDGDVNTEAERAKVPKDLMPMLEKLEKSVAGNGVQLELDFGALGNNLGQLMQQLPQGQAFPLPQLGWQFGVPGARGAAGVPGQAGARGGAGANDRAQAARAKRLPRDGTVRIIEDDITVALSENDGEKHCRAVDEDGNVLFDGPISTKEQRAGLPDEVRDILNDLEVFEDDESLGEEF